MTAREKALEIIGRGVHAVSSSVPELDVAAEIVEALEAAGLRIIDPDQGSRDLLAAILEPTTVVTRYRDSDGDVWAQEPPGCWHMELSTQDDPCDRDCGMTLDRAARTFGPMTPVTS